MYLPSSHRPGGIRCFVYVTMPAVTEEVPAWVNLILAVGGQEVNIDLTTLLNNGPMKEENTFDDGSHTRASSSWLDIAAVVTKRKIKSKSSPQRRIILGLKNSMIDSKLDSNSPKTKSRRD
ncbi:hypothetical protein J6590_071015 [Homalodisca vitripennis]|nr:hypothetical protein J6590_071015 [Homalodisca vitripennis]